MFRFPCEFQLDSMDCGPACLKIICKYYGQYYSIQKLRDICSISKEGVSFSDLCYGAEKLGLRAHATSVTIDDLCKVVKLPCIIHWQDSHFVVVYKVTNKKVYVSDPAKGLVSYRLQEFVNSCCSKKGNSISVLLLEPSPEFKRHNNAKQQQQNMSKVISYFTPYKKSFLILFAVMLLVTILQSSLPFISKAVIDVGIHTQDISFIQMVLIANIVIIISITLSNAVRDWLLMNITSRVNISLISDYLSKLLGLPVTFFENKMIGDILQRAQDHERIRSFIMTNSLGLIFSSLTFIVFSIILIVYNPMIFFIFFVTGLFYVVWVLGFLRIRSKMDGEYFDLVSRNQSYWVETVKAIPDIKINNFGQQRRWSWEKIQTKLYRLNMRILNITNFQNLGGQFCLQIQRLLITFYCAIAVINGEITFGMMISTQFMIGMLSAPLTQFINFIISAQYAKISFMRINEIHELDSEESIAVVANEPIPSNGGISLENVYYRYSHNSDYVLQRINLKIPKGKITALVGGSGSGKSTLLKLLFRFYQPTIGSIKLGDTNIRNISMQEWRRQTGVVLQDGSIFSDTILNNIVLGDEDIDYQRLEEALSIANILDEVKKMDKSYHTTIGEEGRGVSGGQRQRLLIARALYKNPSYLFLDEATNALDAINEAKIVNALNNAFESRTVVVVAHRLSTIRNAHQIVVLNDGVITEIGNHDTLMEHKGHYYNLVMNQMSGSLN